MTKKEQILTETGKRKSVKKQKYSDYDSGWKDIIESLLEPFLEFFYPRVYRDIDFSVKPEFLNTELRSIKAKGKSGNRSADELIRVTLKEGLGDRLIALFVHLEVQGKQEAENVFAERVYVYNYRIFDYNYRRRKNGQKSIEVISMAVLTDNNPAYRPDTHQVARWDFDLTMKIPLVKLIDFRDIPELREKLKDTANPMSTVVKAHLKSLELKGTDAQKRLAVKLDLIREYYKCGYNRRQIEALFRFIDWIIRTPDGLDNQLTLEIQKIEKEVNVRYITSVERHGIKKGRQEGLQEGREQTAREMLMDNQPMEKIKKYSGLTEMQINKLKENATTH